MIRSNQNVININNQIYKLARTDLHIYTPINGAFFKYERGIVSLNIRYHCREAYLSLYIDFFNLHTMSSFPLTENPSVWSI